MNKRKLIYKKLLALKYTNYAVSVLFGGFMSFIVINEMNIDYKIFFKLFTVLFCLVMYYFVILWDMTGFGDK